MWLSYVKTDTELTSEPIQTEDDYEIWGKITEIFHLVGKARTAELATHGLSSGHTHILRTLMKLGGTATISELAEVTIKNHNTISLLVRRMEKAGLVYKTKDKSTNRYEITITEKGAEKLDTMPLHSIELIFSSLTADEKRTLVTILNKLEKKTRNILGLDYIPPLFK